MKKNLLSIILTLLTTLTFAQNKVETTAVKPIQAYMLNGDYKLSTIEIKSLDKDNPHPSTPENSIWRDFYKSQAPLSFKNNVVQNFTCDSKPLKTELIFTSATTLQLTFTDNKNRVSYTEYDYKMSKGNTSITLTRKDPAASEYLVFTK